MTEEINVEKIVNHFISNSDRDYNTMINLYRSKDNNWALFLGHIVIEKLLKAFVVKETAKHPPFSHDLTRLADISKLNFSKEQLDWMDTITTFNLNARYDSFKQEFYKKCTTEFTSEWIEKISNIRTWVKKKL